MKLRNTGLLAAASLVLHQTAAHPFKLGEEALTGGVCSWGKWCSYSDCLTEDNQTPKCGEVGSQVRSRSCECPDGGEKDCPGSAFEESSCAGECPECEGCLNGAAANTPACPEQCKGICSVCTDPTKNCPKGCPNPSDVCKPGDWGEYSGCGNVCGNEEGSKETRTRPCDCGGFYENVPGNCPNDELEGARECSTEPCCTLGEWGEYSECPACLNEGEEVMRTRTRTCDCLDGSDCDGAALSEDLPCEAPSCVTYQWAGWCDGQCSVSCGEGAQTRTRKCTAVTSDGRDITNEPGTDVEGKCEGDSTEQQPCDAGECPPECVMAGWCGWSECNAACGQPQEQLRTRKCWCSKDGESEPYESDLCEGDYEEKQDCPVVECPKICAYSEWSLWGGCTTSCGEGEQSRERSCECTKGGEAVAAEAGDCGGEAESETQMCPENPPCKDCTWAGWCEWGECSATCGTGITRERHRKCRCEVDGVSGPEEVDADDGDCGVEESAQIEECALDACPIVTTVAAPPACEWGEWCPWASCSSVCPEPGFKSRTRKCNCEDGQDGACLDDADGIGFEQRDLCNTDCAPTPEPESDCDDGTKTDDVVPTPEDSNAAAGTDAPGVSDGSGTGDSGGGENPSGDDGTQTGDPDNGGNGGGDVDEIPSIDITVTGDPIDDVLDIDDDTTRVCWSDWSEWSACAEPSAECPCGGCGEQTRERKCLCGSDPTCPGCDGAPATEVQACAAEQLTCTNGNWGCWSECPKCKTINTEATNSTRTRKCECPEGALEGCTDGCADEMEEVKPCDIDSLPECEPVCAWSEWCGWSDCDKTCDAGMRTRSRKCSCEDAKGATYDADECDGVESPNFEDAECSNGPCEGSGPEDPKTKCEKACEDLSAQLGEDALLCKAECTDDEPDPVDDQCSIGDYGDWSECVLDQSETCGKGVRHRSKDCVCPEGVANVCDDLALDFEPCEVPCPEPEGSPECEGAECPDAGCPETECPEPECPDESCDAGPDCEDDDCEPECSGDECDGGSDCEGDDCDGTSGTPECSGDDCTLPPVVDPTEGIPLCDGPCVLPTDAPKVPPAPTTPEGSAEEVECVDDCPSVKPEACPPKNGTEAPLEPPEITPPVTVPATEFPATETDVPVTDLAPHMTDGPVVTINQVTPACEGDSCGCDSDCDGDDCDCEPASCPEGEDCGEAFTDEPCPEGGCPEPETCPDCDNLGPEPVTPPAVTDAAATDGGECRGDCGSGTEPAFTPPPVTEVDPTEPQATTEPGSGDDGGCSECNECTDGCDGSGDEDPCGEDGCDDIPVTDGPSGGCEDGSCAPTGCPADGDCPEPECPDEECGSTDPSPATTENPDVTEFIPVTTTLPPPTAAGPTAKPQCLCPDEKCDDSAGACPKRCEANECNEPCKTEAPCTASTCGQNAPTPEPVCKWDEFCNWSECTKECDGRQIRSRKCICPDDFGGDPDCPGSQFEFKDCDACLAPTEESTVTEKPVEASGAMSLKPDMTACQEGNCFNAIDMQGFRLAAPNLEGAGEKLGQTFSSGDVDELKESLISKRSLSIKRTRREILNILETTLPRKFDARAKWPGYIAPVADTPHKIVQGSCGAAWARSSASVTADRYAINTGQRVNISVDVGKLTDCEYTFQDELTKQWLRATGGLGIHGGTCTMPARVELGWEVLKKTTVPMGCDDLRSSMGSWSGSAKHKSTSGSDYGYKKRSHLTCGSAYTLSSNNNVDCALHKGHVRRLHAAPLYRIGSNQRDIQDEILWNGPVQAMLRLFPDLATHTDIYRVSLTPIQIQRSSIVYHPVKIIGWGVDEDASPPQDYWLAQTDVWGPTWHDRGVFKIARGENMAEVESFVTAIKFNH